MDTLPRPNIGRTGKPSARDGPRRLASQTEGEEGTRTDPVDHIGEHGPPLGPTLLSFWRRE